MKKEFDPMMVVMSIQALNLNEEALKHILLAGTPEEKERLAEVLRGFYDKIKDNRRKHFTNFLNDSLKEHDLRNAFAGIVSARLLRTMQKEGLMVPRKS